MRISSDLQINAYSKRPLSFKSTNRWEFGPKNKIICNYTKFLREDLDFKCFVKELENKYKYAPKVNILNLACSDGSESLSLMGALLHYASEFASKCFPIIASDINEFVIKHAQSYSYFAGENDLLRINTILGHYSDYFSIEKAPENSCSFPFILTTHQNYRNNVIFKKCDMIDALSDLQPQNNVVLCRNAIKYLDDNKRLEMLNTLAERLDSTSLLAIGALDNGHSIDKQLIDRGFKHYNLENIYIKT